MMALFHNSYAFNLLEALTLISFLLSPLEEDHPSCCYWLMKDSKMCFKSILILPSLHYHITHMSVINNYPSALEYDLTPRVISSTTLHLRMSETVKN